MSGESSRTSVGAQAFERAFGEKATCNRCVGSLAEYRVIATFLHDTVAVRAYCGACYEVALEGEYHARGDGLVMDYASFAERFGAPGPPPPPKTPVDAILSALLRDGTMHALRPPSEALARRQRLVPYRFEVEIAAGDGAGVAELRVERDGHVASLSGPPGARAAVERALAATRR